MKALIVIDMQNDFIDGSLGTPQAQAIVKNVKAKIEEYHKNNSPVVFTRDTHDKNYLETQEGKKLPIVHCIKDTYGWQLHEQLATEAELVFDKPTFGSIELAKYLCLLKGLREVEIVGLCTDICVISNALLIKAYLPELEITVDSSCCSGVTPESHENALKSMEMCQIKIK